MTSFLDIDTDRSTVMVGARRYPVALVICPEEDEAPDRTEWDRSLGAGSRWSQQAIIPAENGLLFDLQTMDSLGGERDGFALAMTSRFCSKVDNAPVGGTEPPWIWLPQTVSLVDGDLVVGWHGTWYWESADAEWVIETIDRLSHKPLEEPSGPPVRLVPVNYFDK